MVKPRPLEDLMSCVRKNSPCNSAGFRVKVDVGIEEGAGTLSVVVLFALFQWPEESTTAIKHKSRELQRNDSIFSNQIIYYEIWRSKKELVVFNIRIHNNTVSKITNTVIFTDEVSQVSNVSENISRNIVLCQ